MYITLGPALRLKAYFLFNLILYVPVNMGTGLPGLSQY